MRYPRWMIWRPLVLTSLVVACSLLVGTSASDQVKPISDDEASSAGPGHPWQGRLPGINPFSLAKQTTLPIVAWVARGGLPVSLALYHNTQAERFNPAIGPGWNHSYDTSLDFWTDKKGVRRAAVVWGNHTVELFAFVNGIWTAQDGYRDRLEATGGGFAVIVKSSLIRFEFSPHPTVDGRFRLTRVVDPNGNALTFTYDANQRLSTIVDPSGRTIQFKYSANAGTLDAIVFGNVGRTWQLLYDRTHRPISLVFPRVTTDAGTQTFDMRLEYNAQDNIVRIVDRAGQSWEYGYHDGRLAFAQPPASKQRWEFARAGSVRKFTDPRGNTTRYEYDSLSRLVRAEDPLGNAYRWKFTDPLYRFAPNESILPSDRTFHFGYDFFGNATATIDPAGNRTDYTYDNLNRMIRVQEPQVTGEPARHRTDILRDPNGNPIEIRRFTDPINYVATKLEYDAFGQLTRRIDPLGHAVEYQDDAFGNLIGLTSPAGRQWRWRYDNASSTLEFTLPNAYIDPLGQQTALIRDEWGRLREINYADGGTVRYSYDPRNNLVRVADSTGVTQREYDANGRLVAETKGATRVEYKYFPNDQRSTLMETSSAGQRTLFYEYDAAGRLSRLTEGALPIDYSYDPDGRLTQKSLPNGQVDVQIYDLVGRLIKKFSSVFGALFRDFTYAYLENGLVAQASEQNGSATNYSYDFLNRVVREERTGPAAYDLRYGYDAAGNRVTKTRDGDATAYSYDNDNLPILAQAASGPSTQYAWNGNGSLSRRVRSDGVTVQFHWDAANRLAGLETPAGSHVYSYDGLGRRTGFFWLPVVGDQDSVEIVYDGSDVIRENVSAGGATSRSLAYTWDWFGLARSRDDVSQTSSWSATDLLGSLRGFTDDRGQPGAYSSVFSLPGETIAERGTRTPYAFMSDFGLRTDDNTGTGDHAGLINYNAGSNYYDPEIGQAIHRLLFATLTRRIVFGNRGIGPPEYPVVQHPDWVYAEWGGPNREPGGNFVYWGPSAGLNAGPEGDELRRTYGHYAGGGPLLVGPLENFPDRGPVVPIPVPPFRPIVSYTGARPGWWLPFDRAPWDPTMPTIHFPRFFVDETGVIRERREPWERITDALNY